MRRTVKAGKRSSDGGDPPTKAMIVRRVKRWARKLNLHDWDIVVEIADLEDGNAADCEAQPGYLYAVLRFDPEAFGRDQVDETVVHELVHLLLWELSGIATFLGAENQAVGKWVSDVEETLVTRITRILTNT